MRDDFLSFLSICERSSFPPSPPPENIFKVYYDYQCQMRTELKTLEWWISGLMLNPLFFLISRLNIACSPLIFNLQINYPISQMRTG